MSILDINPADISDTASGNVTGNGLSWVNADRVASVGSPSGMQCGGSFCNARDASVSLVNDGTAECDLNGFSQCVGFNSSNCPEFGYSAHSGAFFDINGATVSGTCDLPYAPTPTNTDGTRLFKYTP